MCSVFGWLMVLPRSFGVLSMQVALALMLSHGFAIAKEKTDIRNGSEIATRYCAQCHAIGARGASPNPDAPPFRILHESYPVNDLSEALAEGIFVGHPEMPDFALQPSQIEAFIAYLKSLR
jgi:mono/diheme cytochrome c family protein